MTDWYEGAVFRELSPGRCWWCSAPATSREHKFKRSDLVRDYGKGPFTRDGGLISSSGDSSARIQGPNSKLVKFDPVMCEDCNNARSQPLDRAYDALIEFVWSHEEDILENGGFDLRDVFGSAWRAQSNDALRYYVKHICCRLAECLPQGRVSVEESVFGFLDGRPEWPRSIAAEFFIDPGFQAISDLLRVGGENPAHHEMTQVWADLDEVTGEVIGPQARLSYRWFRFAWQVNGLDPRPRPFAGPTVELPRIETLPSEFVEDTRARIVTFKG